MSLGGHVLVAAATLVASLSIPCLARGQVSSETRGAGSGDQVECSRTSTNRPEQRAAPLKKTVQADSDPQTQVVNFGTSRDEKQFDVVVKLTPALTSDVTDSEITGAHLYLEAPRRLTRVGAKAESELLALPRFSDPEVAGQGDEITFTVCIRGLNSEGEDMKPGSYVGQVRLGGPGGLSRSVTTVTVNAKAKLVTFAIGATIALIVAAFLLWFQEFRSARTEKWGLGFWLQTAVALGLAFGALITIYYNDPSWGSEDAAWIALIGAAVGAAGLKSFLEATFTPGSGGGGGNPDA